MRYEEDILPQYIWLWEAYWGMQGDRVLAMGGIRPTPWETFDRWAERHGLSSAEYREAWYLIGQMDNEQLAFDREQREKAKRQSGGGSVKNAGVGRRA